MTKQIGAESLRKTLGLITASELYALLGIAATTGRNRQCAGNLPPHYKVGHEKFYRLTEVEVWINRQRVGREPI